MQKKTIDRYYEELHYNVVTFTKQVCRKVGLVRGDSHIRIRGETLPCLIYSLSMERAVVILRINETAKAIMAQTMPALTLHVRFSPTKESISLMLDAQIEEIKEYGEKVPDTYFLALRYRRKAPNDLIKILGELIEAEKEKERRIFERINLDPQNAKKMGLSPAETFLFCQGEGKKCVLQEISVFSARVVISGHPADYEGNKAMLIMKIESAGEIGEMLGSVYSAEELGNNLVSVVVHFDQEVIPPSYKMFIGTYIDVLARH